MPHNAKDQIKAISEVIRMAQEDFSSVRTTQIAGILRAMRDTVERVKISLILPRLVEDRETLKRKLTGTQYQAALAIVANYSRRRNIILREQRSPLMDHGMIRIIDYFQLHNEMLDMFPGYMSSLSEDERKVLQAFEMLFELADRHLNQDAQSKIKAERSMQRNYKAVKEIKEQIKLLKVKIKEEKVAAHLESHARVSFLSRLEMELADDRRKLDFRLHKENDKHVAAIIAKEKASLENQTALKEEVNNAKLELQKQSKSLKKWEKVTRQEKNKVLIQLQGTIKKYDTVLYEKYLEQMSLETQLKEEQEKMDEFMVVYRAEEEAYNEIVYKREKEDERKKQERILRFMLNRAARKIQQYWHRWRDQQKKKQRRLNKNKKHKKQK